MLPGIAPQIQIIAAGVCPQGLSPGDTASNVIGARVVNSGTGVWQVTATDPSVLPGGACVLIAFPGNGSNLAGGISFGQSVAQTVNGETLFSFESYRNDTGAPIDVEVQFLIVRWTTNG